MYNYLKKCIFINYKVKNISLNLDKQLTYPSSIYRDLLVAVFIIIKL